MGGATADWLSRLVQIPSVGPGNVGTRSGQSNELRIANQLAEWFTGFGGEVSLEDVFPGRPNVYAIWRGTSDRWLAVDVHTDTVGVETMQGDPFDGRITDGRVYGRGSVDTKASLGIVLALLEKLHANGQKLESNLLVCASADEETGCHGAAVFADWVRRQGIQIDQLMVAEPTMCGPIYGHRGSAGIIFEIEGTAAHSSRPELGKNSISAAAPLIMALDAEHQRIASQPPQTPVGTGTVTVTMIQGGQAMNIVPPNCRLYVDRRVVPGEDPVQLADDLYAYAKQHCPLPLTMKTLHTLTAFYQPPDTPWVQQLAEWAGVPPTVAPYGTNAWAYNGLARECVIWGPGSIEQAHRDVEWVEIAQLEKAAEIYMRWWGLS